MNKEPTYQKVIRELLAPIFKVMFWLLLTLRIFIQDPKYKWFVSHKFNYVAVVYYTLGIILFLIYKQQIYEYIRGII